MQHLVAVQEEWADVKQTDITISLPALHVVARPYTTFHDKTLPSRQYTLWGRGDVIK
jgi:hypothetical protein